MLKPRYAIMLDGGFVLKKLETALKRQPTAQDVIQECEKIRNHPALADYELLRVYFYHAPPCTDSLINPISKSPINFATTATCSRMKSLLDSLELSPDFALRLGETTAQGWRLGSAALKDIEKNGARTLKANDLEPDIKQKGVDLRIGLDMARLTLKEIVRVIVVATADADMVPAFKFARREGIRVYLYGMGHSRTRRDLKAHTDLMI